MYIKLDKSKMEVVVLCGILENYKPSKNIKEIHKKVDSLKEQMDKFMKEVIEPELTKIDDMISKENDKHIVKDPSKEK